MLSALDDGNYAQAIELADQILEKNYLYPEAHIASILAHEELGQTRDADYHRYVRKGLINSILHSGDGKKPESAYVVVLIEEEYLILDVLGISEGGQSMTSVGGHFYDVFTGVDTQTNKPVTVYFNIDTPFHKLYNTMNP